MSIDELLTAASEHREEPDPGAFGLVSVLTILALGAVLGLASYQLIMLLGHRVPYPLLSGVWVALMFARKITLASHGGIDYAGTVPELEPQPQAGRRRPVDDRPYDGIRRWVIRLGQVEGDTHAFNRSMHLVLVGLVDERLRLRHGVDRRRDPERARALLGEPLWSFVSAPVRQAPNPRQLAALAEQIQKL